MENPPAKRVYKKREEEEDLEVSEDEDLPESDDDNQSVISDMTECSLIGTTYKKNTDLKRLDTKLREKLYNTGYDSQDRISNLFTTLRNVNPKYGLPILEQRTEPRLEQFYKDTLINLG